MRLHLRLPGRAMERLRNINDGWARQMNREMHDNRKAGMAGTGARRRLGSRGGFTLAETLLAVLIMLLVSVIVATGMPAVTNAYNKVVLGANAKVMLSTAITALHDEIGTAWQVENPDNDHTRLSYFNADKGANSVIFLGTDEAIWVQDYMPLDEENLIHGTGAKQGTAYHLVAEGKSDKTRDDYTTGMYVTYTSITWDENTGIVTIGGLKVCKKSDKSTLVEFAGKDGTPKDFKVRVISKDAAQTD